MTPKYWLNSKMDRTFVIYAKKCYTIVVSYVKFGQIPENRIFGPFLVILDDFYCLRGFLEVNMTPKY